MGFEGSCHCGKLKVTVDEDMPTKGMSCNCSICRRKGNIHHFTSPDKATITADDGDICSSRSTSTRSIPCSVPAVAARRLQRAKSRTVRWWRSTCAVCPIAMSTHWKSNITMARASSERSVSFLSACKATAPKLALAGRHRVRAPTTEIDDVIDNIANESNATRRLVTLKW